MRYVIFDADSKEIRSAMAGPEPSDPGPGLRAGDAGDVTFEGALKNYVFVPDEPTAGGTLTGHVERKPEEEWDLKAEKEERDRHTVMMRFHQLDIADVRKLEIHLMIPSRFARLLEPTVALCFTLEGISLEVMLSHLKPIALDVGFEFGGYTVPFQRTSIRFDLSSHEPFLATALDAQLGKMDEIGRKLFTSQTLKNESLQFALRVANHLIEAYRIAYDDPSERPIGVADVLSAAMVIELSDGLRQIQHSGISIGPDVRNTRDQQQRENAELAMATLLSMPSPPFSAVALVELKKAHLYGQYRECLVWAGTIIANVIEDILLQRLPKNSREYHRLRTKSSEIRGATKRGSYFKLATGRTLWEWLEHYERESKFWEGLASNIETILNERNLLLHRKKAIGAKEARAAFETCMNFLYALQWGIPFNPEDATYRF